MNLRRMLENWFLAGVAASCALSGDLGAAAPAKAFPAAVKRNLDEEARLIVNLLQNYHYSGRAFRDIENKEMIERFLSELDPEKFVFSQADLDSVHRRFERTLKTVYVYKGDMQPAQEIYALLVDRSRQRFDWIEQRLAGPFDLTRQEPVDPADLERAADTGAEDRRWELRLTNELIYAMLEGRDERAARDSLVRHYRKVRRYGAGFDPYEVRAMFLDSIIRSFDPRSGYFSADSTREFALEMEGAVTGIGIDVSKDEGRCIVDRVHPGGPADLHSDLQPGDELVAIGNEGEPLAPVAGMRLREVTGRLRGMPDTNVALQYTRAEGGPAMEITLKRERVTLILRRASGSVYSVPGGDGGARRIGIVAFPSFYSSEEAGGSSVAADVAGLLAKMTAGGIDGLVIDLRGNPGGSMEEAIRLCGLFLRSGPAAYSRPQSGETVPYPVKPADAVYDGPLVVLTDPSSASASELFSGSLQKHSRAFVLGGESTLGKGTVQNYLNLEKMQPQGPQRDWGTLRLTYAMFNLPDGSPIQATGVASDAVLPLKPEEGAKPESELDHSLRATPMKVPPLEPQPGGPRIPADSPLLRDLAARVASNLATLPEWRLWIEENEHYSPPDTEPLSLSLDVRRSEWDDWIRTSESLANRRRELLGTAAYAIEPVDLDSTAEAKRAHDERLRTLLAGRPVQPIARLDGGGFVVETDNGHLRRLRWGSFRLARYTGQSAALADAFNAGAGTQLDRDAIGVIFAELLLLEQPSNAGARAVFERHMPEGTPPETLQAGIDAMLARILELEPNLRAERWVFDIPLREAVRTASAWADAGSPASPEAVPAP